MPLSLVTAARQAERRLADQATQVAKLRLTVADQQQQIRELRRALQRITSAKAHALDLLNATANSDADATADIHDLRHGTSPGADQGPSEFDFSNPPAETNGSTGDHIDDTWDADTDDPRHESANTDLRQEAPPPALTILNATADIGPIASTDIDTLRHGASPGVNRGPGESDLLNTPTNTTDDVGGHTDYDGNLNANDLSNNAIADTNINTNEHVTTLNTDQKLCDELTDTNEEPNELNDISSILSETTPNADDEHATAASDDDTASTIARIKTITAPIPMPVDQL